MNRSCCNHLKLLATKMHAFQLLSALIVLLLISGASGSSQESPVAPGQSENALKQVWEQVGWEFEEGWKPVTDSEAVQKWASAFVQAIKDQNRDKLSELVEFEPLFRRCVSKIANEKFRIGFSSGAKNGGRQLLERLADPAGSYRFLGVHNSEFGPAAMMRMLDANGGCNYHLWRFQHDPLGDIKGVDIYIFLSGESFADTLQRMAMITAPQGKQGFLAKLTGKETVLAKHQGDLINLIHATQIQDFEGALDHYDRLPQQLQTEKAIMLMRILAAMRVTDAEYLLALKDYRKQFPDDASADLASIDYYFLNQQFQQMHEALSRLEKSVGRDAHLLLLHSVAFSGESKFDLARKSTEEAINLEPELESPYWTQVEICLRQQDYDAVNQTLILLTQRFGYREFDFAIEPIYDEYVKTPQHKAFLKYLDELGE